MSKTFYEVKVIGDNGILVRFEEKIDININKKVNILKENLLNEKIEGVVELVPSYRSLLIIYDPTKISYLKLKDKVLKLSLKEEDVTFKTKRVIKLPAYFGSDLAIDLTYVAKYHNIPEQKVVKTLLKRIYFVYMYGFYPGFIYLGGLPKILHTPRVSTPRINIPKGSIGIGGEQLGIYSLNSPGGFRIVGFTYENLIILNKKIEPKIKEGDFIKFEKVSKECFLKNYYGDLRFY